MRASPGAERADGSGDKVARLAADVPATLRKLGKALSAVGSVLPEPGAEPESLVQGIYDCCPKAVEPARHVNKQNATAQRMRGKHELAHSRKATGLLLAEFAPRSAARRWRNVRTAEGRLPPGTVPGSE
jgi:hypothetical protein